MNEINSFDLNHHTNVESNYFQKNDLLVKTICKSRWNDMTGEWIKTCTDYPDSGNTNSVDQYGIPKGNIVTVFLVLIIFISSVIFFRVFTLNKGNIKETKTNIKKNYLNKISGTKKLNNSNNLDLISFIEELKEEKYPDASIGESFVKGSYVILKDLNGKTIAEIKIPE